jgi:hypothetical protein
VLLCTEESKMSESEFADSDLTFEQKEEIWNTIKAPKVNWCRWHYKILSWKPELPRFPWCSICISLPANKNKINLHVTCSFGHHLSQKGSVKIYKCKYLYSQVWTFQLSKMWKFPIFCRKACWSNSL